MLCVCESCCRGAELAFLYSGVVLLSVVLQLALTLLQPVELLQALTWLLAVALLRTLALVVAWQVSRSVTCE